MRQTNVWLLVEQSSEDKPKSLIGLKEAFQHLAMYDIVHTSTDDKYGRCITAQGIDKTQVNEILEV